MRLFSRKLLFFAALIVAFTSSASVSDAQSRFTPFSAKIPGDVYAQPKVIDDVDGDGKRDLVFGAVDGKVHLFSSSGKEIVRPPFWPKQTGAPIMSEVAVADLTGDNRPEILVSSLNGKVYCIDANGRELWKVDTRGTIRLSSPEIADIDGTGNMRVFVGSRSGTVTHIDAAGRVVWEHRMNSSVSTRVVAVDINGNGVKEIVAKDDSGRISVININGVTYPGWPQDTVPNLTWPFEVGAADLDGDGMREVFTTTPERELIIWRHNGEVQGRFALSDAAHSAPRVVDLNSNGKNEFVIGQADGTVLVCDVEGKPLPGWPYRTGHSIYHTPRVLDIDGDRKLDVVFTAWNPEGVGAQAGYIMALNQNGQPLSGYPKYIGKTLAPLTFADLNGDGYLEMIAMGGINYTADQLHVFLTEAKVHIKMATLGTELRSSGVVDPF